MTERVWSLVLLLGALEAFTCGIFLQAEPSRVWALLLLLGGGSLACALVDAWHRP